VKKLPITDHNLLQFYTVVYLAVLVGSISEMKMDIFDIDL